MGSCFLWECNTRNVSKVPGTPGTSRDVTFPKLNAPSKQGQLELPCGHICCHCKFCVDNLYQGFCNMFGSHYGLLILARVRTVNMYLQVQEKFWILMIFLCYYESDAMVQYFIYWSVCLCHSYQTCPNQPTNSEIRQFVWFSWIMVKIWIVAN